MNFKNKEKEKDIKTKIYTDRTPRKTGKYKGSMQYTKNTIQTAVNHRKKLYFIQYIF